MPRSLQPEIARHHEHVVGLLPSRRNPMLMINLAHAAWVASTNGRSCGVPMERCARGEAFLHGLIGGCFAKAWWRLFALAMKRPLFHT